MKKLTSLSLFFPAYNEEANIEAATKQALEVLPQIAEEFEIIIINDGSKDNTRKIALELENKYKQVRLVSQRNKGYGGALKRGFKEAKLDWIFFTDSDLQFNLKELKKFITKAHKNDFILGFRKNRAEGKRRFLLAKALKVWNIILLGFPAEIKDIDCAFKLMRTEVIRTIEPLFSDGAMISTEMLLKMYNYGFQFEQIGVTHYERQFGSSTGSNLNVILKAVRDTFILRVKLLENKVNQITTRWS
jgi:glycosyltransferase involved in cell wall biosynthesis